MQEEKGVKSKRREEGGRSAGRNFMPEEERVRSKRGEEGGKGGGRSSIPEEERVKSKRGEEGGRSGGRSGGGKGGHGAGKALQCCKSAVSSDPKDYDIYQNIGKVLLSGKGTLLFLEFHVNYLSHLKTILATYFFVAYYTFGIVC